jgi:predicted acylesterase/phospholipase RssA
MANIFISYNRQSEAIARTLANDIEALGHTVWFDHELSGGQAWWDQILTRVRECTVFVFVLDEAALKSTACKREYGYADDLGKPILPVLVSAGLRLSLLPLALSKIQFVDYRKQDRDAVLRLGRALTAVPPPIPPPDPLPAPPEVPISYLGSLAEMVEKTSLSYEEQSGLQIKLKRSLRDPATSDDARMLLESLRKREDLFAHVRDEIDELLQNTGKAPPLPSRSSEANSIVSKPPQRKEETLSRLADDMPREEPDLRGSVTEPARTGIYGLTTPERMKPAGMTRQERNQRKQQNVARAKLILQGSDASLQELTQLANDLKADTSFGYGWKIFSRARRTDEVKKDAKLNLKLAQKQAVCTYKDPDLPADQRLKRAFEILEQADDLRTTTNQETLGLAGAINKRTWEVDGQKLHLERALAFYRRGYRLGVDSDNGYTGINAAFVLDLLAEQEEEESRDAYASSETAPTRRTEAREIRKDIAEKLTRKAEQPANASLKDQWWFVCTVAEAYLGQQIYDQAAKWLRQAATIEDVPEWERESTVRQLARLAQLQKTTGGEGKDGGGAANFADPRAWDTLREFLKLLYSELPSSSVEAALKSAFRGKVGLGLSGGGFRASLYHIGVLAKLAELDILRHVEVLSCVSGGSIIGAHYYLEVRKLLQEKADNAITRDDYIQMVKRIAEDFLAGVQTNIRMRVAAGWWTNVKMIFLPNYSRTMRVGELYEKQIYSRIKDRSANEKYQPRWLNDLTVQPIGEVERFTPKYDNWRRAAKVPILVLNATTLNTGHNWQFTATWMGEPPSAIDTHVDGNYRLRRMYYEDAPKAYQRYRLGYAVAASSCVPGLFEPLPLPNLYEHAAKEEKVTVRLVDGGVHDNQGTASLLEQGCAVLLVSDASGQSNSIDDPGSGSLGVVMRSSTILQGRVRESQYRELAAQRRASIVQGLMFIHLKMDLDVDPVDWINCPDPSSAMEDGPRELRGPLTRYRINKKMQESLAGVRTDLDSFCDAEAYALMTSGYCMTEYCFPKHIPAFTPPDLPREKWPFLDTEKPLQELNSDPRLTKLLKVASNLAFKVWMLWRPLQITAAVLALTLIALLVFFYERWWGIALVKLTLGGLVVMGGMFLLGKILGSTVMKFVNYRKTLEEFAVGFIMSFLGFAIARLHVHVFDRWYLRLGKLNRVLK